MGIDNVCKPECRASSLKSETSCKITMKHVWIVTLIYKKIFVTQGVCHLINMVPIEIEFCLFCRGFLRRSALRGRLSRHWKLSTDKKNEIQFVFNGGELSAAAKQAIVFKWRHLPLQHRATFLASPLFLCVDIAIVYFAIFCCFGWLHNLEKREGGRRNHDVRNPDLPPQPETRAFLDHDLWGLGWDCTGPHQSRPILPLSAIILSS